LEEAFQLPRIIFNFFFICIRPEGGKGWMESQGLVLKLEGLRALNMNNKKTKRRRNKSGMPAVVKPSKTSTLLCRN
jgi:hypothetical protein